MLTRFFLFLFLVTLSVSACQTTTTLYDKLSFTSRPSSTSYANSDEFVRDSIVYLFPRACVFYQTSDGTRNSENQKPDGFSFNSIVENEKKDGWYAAYLSVSNANYGVLRFYFNKDTGDYSCTGNKTKYTNAEIDFINNRRIDLQGLSRQKIMQGKPSKRWGGVGIYTDEYVCNLAIDHSGHPIKWDTENASVAKYVTLAKRRGLKIKDCLQYERTASKPSQKIKASPEIKVSDKAKDLLGQKCINKFKTHLELTTTKKHTVFAYSEKISLRTYACGNGLGDALNEAKAAALRSCNFAKSNMYWLSDAPCKIFAIGDKIVW